MDTTSYTESTSQAGNAGADEANQAYLANAENREEAVRRRAHELYESRCAGERDGDELSDWLEAERLVLFTQPAGEATENQLRS